MVKNMYSSVSKAIVSYSLNGGGEVRCQTTLTQTEKKWVVYEFEGPIKRDIKCRCWILG
jgi:hypothetical protein